MRARNLTNFIDKIPLAGKEWELCVLPSSACLIEVTYLLNVGGWLPHTAKDFNTQWTKEKDENLIIAFASTNLTLEKKNFCKFLNCITEKCQLTSFGIQVKILIHSSSISPNCAAQCSALYVHTTVQARCNDINGKECTFSHPHTLTNHPPTPRRQRVAYGKECKSSAGCVDGRASRVSFIVEKSWMGRSAYYQQASESGVHETSATEMEGYQHNRR